MSMNQNKKNSNCYRCADARERAAVRAYTFDVPYMQVEKTNTFAMWNGERAFPMSIQYKLCTAVIVVTGTAGLCSSN